ncbi:MAG TPA: patatin-like phospholipase family protein [Candidatus Eisenbacteria bacterium]|nr:patatin-like phospholipase family protein [Candidatus Eisenbacteria bacterium]
MDSPRNSETNPRFQKIDKLALLAQCPLFSGLSQWELKSISQLMRLVEYKKDECVYKEGGEAEAFYVVVSGRFEAFVSTLEKKKVLAYLRRGDYFGEMSLLTKQPHSATLRALSDSLTLVLKKDDFEKTIEHNATVSLELSRRLSTRLKGGDPRSRSLLKSDIISVYSHQRKTGRAAFSINLAASLLQETRQKTILLDMSPTGHEIASRLQMAQKVPLTRFANIENEAPDVLANLLTRHPLGFEVLSVAHQERDPVGENIIIPLLNHLAIEYRFILIDLPPGVDELVFKAFSQSDGIFFVTDSNINNITETRDTVEDLRKNLSFSEDKISVVINEVFYGVRTTANMKKEIFGKKYCYSLPTTPALHEREGHSVMPFVVEEPDTEYSRVIRHIARRISNNLVGLVLGSGAALGLAHVGVIKVLERERIPVDMISGSSVGSIVGSLLAVGKSAEEIERAALEINTRLRLLRLLDPSVWPVRGLMDGRAFPRYFKKYLGTKTFEDCVIPLKIVGANLSTREIVVFESGFLLDAMRCSIAIPAIFKPTIRNNEVIVDGGILSPLPVRALHLAGANKVIAVNVFPTAKDTLERRILQEEAAEKEEKLMRQKNFLLRGMHRVGKGLGRRFAHNIFDILMNTIQTMESEISEMEGESADVLIRPVVSNANWVDFYKPQQFIKRGEEETMRLLPKIKLLVSQQNA